MNNVKTLRIKAGMTQKELVHHMGVSQPTVSNWEKGVINPAGENLKELARLFNVSVGEILGMEEIEESQDQPEATIDRMRSGLVNNIIEEVEKLPPEKQKIVKAFIDGLKYSK